MHIVDFVRKGSFQQLSGTSYFPGCRKVFHLEELPSQTVFALALISS